MKYSKLFIFATLFYVCVSHSVVAVTPNIRFPEWCKAKFQIQSWNPKLRTLTIKTSVIANKTKISKLSSKVFWPVEFSAGTDVKKKENLQLNESINFYHTSIIQSPFNGWVQCQVKGIPDKESLKQLVRSKNGTQSMTTEILIKEIDSAKSYLVVSKTLPIYVDSNIAFTGTKELLFDSKWKEKKSLQYYFWYPPENIGGSFTSETLKVLRSALLKQSAKAVMQACDLLLKRLIVQQNNVEIISKESKFYLPISTLSNFIEANKLSIEIITSLKFNEINQIQAKVDRFPASFARCFVFANFATTCRGLNRLTLAKKYYKKALHDLPAWPLLIKWIDKIK